MAEYYKSIGENVRRKFSTICLFIGNTVNVQLNGSTYTDHRNLLVARYIRTLPLCFVLNTLLLYLVG